MLNGFDIDLAADQTRLTNRLRDALTSISPALERALGERLHQAGVRDLLTKYPTLTALRAASQSRIERTVKARSPRSRRRSPTPSLLPWPPRTSPSPPRPPPAG